MVLKKERKDIKFSGSAGFIITILIVFCVLGGVDVGYPHLGG